MVSLVIGLCTVIGTALLLWFGGYQYLFTSDGVDPRNGQVRGAAAENSPRGAKRALVRRIRRSRESDPWYRKNRT